MRIQFSLFTLFVFVTLVLTSVFVLQRVFEETAISALMESVTDTNSIESVAENRRIYLVFEYPDLNTKIRRIPSRAFPNTISRLFPLLKDACPKTRRRATYTLGVLANKCDKDRQPLLSALVLLKEDDDFDVQHEAYRTLTKLTNTK